MTSASKEAKPGSWSARAREALEAEGHRAGGARSAVIELLAGEDCCLTAQEILDRLGERGEEIGIASVYRALDLLHAALERAIDRLGKRLRHAVAAHDVVIHGACPRCERPA
jgi:Fur family ferric uptake transcriptional regulator